MGAPLLEVKNLKTYFPVRTGAFKKKIGDVKAVDNVSFHINRQETFGLVGESGCGKTTIGKTILRLVPATGGEIIFNNKNMLRLNKEELRCERKNIQMVFQDPYGSLNPRMNVLNILSEPMKKHKIYPPDEIADRVANLVSIVGLSTRDIFKYPHEFSGGQRQRVVIARALASNPKLIVCDEPVSALDVSIQAQILNLLNDLKKKFGLSYLFIAHGMAVVKHISDRVGSMYLGHLVEVSFADEIFNKCLHPYTKALISSIPIPDPSVTRQKVTLQGEIPNPINPPKGCKFNPRCPHAFDACRCVEPELKEYEPNHYVACHLYDKS